MAMASQQQQQEDPKVIPVKVLADKQANKVVAVEATKDFVDTLFSFLSLPLATIIRLLNNKHDDNNCNDDDNNCNDDDNEEQETPEDEDDDDNNCNDEEQETPEDEDDGNNNCNDEEQETPEPLLGCITNLYQSVENLTVNDIWNSVCKDMLLCPRNPCEQLCMELFLNVDDTEPTPKVLVCDSCNRFTTFQKLACVCGKVIDRTPHDLDLEAQGENNKSSHVGDARSGVFVKENGFLVFDDLTVVPSSLVTSMEMLIERGYSDLSQLEQFTQNFGKQEILNLLKNTIISHEPLTNTILASNSKRKDNPLNQFASAIRVRPATSNSKMDVKLVRSKSQNRIVSADAKEDFVDFLFSFLSIPLGSIVKLLGGTSLVGSVDNLYKSVETLDSSWCTDSCSVLLNPGLAPQFGFPNQPLNIPDVEPPNYVYGTGTTKMVYSRYGPYRQEEARDGGVISKSDNGSIANVRRLTALDPRSPNRSKENVVGFVWRPELYTVGDDLRVRPVSTNSCLFYLKELNLPLDDLEVKVISISEAEALSLLGASLTSKYALTSGLEDFLDVPKQESSLTSKNIQTSRLDDLLKEEPDPET